MAFSDLQESGRPISIYDEGILLASNIGSIDFAGAGVTGSVLGTAVTETIPGSSGGGKLTATGTVNGVNDTFTFSSAPTLIVVDQGRAMQKTSSDGTVNWTGTTTVVLAVAPNNDIYGIA